MAAGQLADGVGGEEEDHPGLASCLAQLPERILLVGGQAVFQKVNVVGH